MYQALLTRRYLTTKLMPALAALAVMLCTATVLVVWSVMGGFLTMLLGSGRTLMGDVSIAWPNSGFVHYDDLRRRLEARPEVEATTPVIDTFGIVTLPDDRIEGVQIKGIDAQSYARVVDFEQTIWWRALSTPLPRDHARLDPRLDPEREQRYQRAYADALRLREFDPETGLLRPAVMLGIELSGFNSRQPSGAHIPMAYGTTTTDGSVRWNTRWLVDDEVRLNVLPVTTKGRAIEVVTRPFPVANEFKTNLFEVDSSTVLVDLPALQQMLKMDGGARTREFDRFGVSVDSRGRESFDEVEEAGVEPPRVTTVLVRAAEGVDVDRLKEVCVEVYTEFEREHQGEVPSIRAGAGGIRIETWAERQGTFVAAVEKETVMVLFILGVVSLTCTFLILAIFWAMVSEKTKDIGVMRAVGAGRAGVAAVWIIFGLVIGLIGSALGGALAHAIIWNINPIHEWLGTALGVQIWDPRVYYFSEIPSNVEPAKAALVTGLGVAFSALGAVVPAVRAARLDPVRALRFE